MGWLGVIRAHRQAEEFIVISDMETQLGSS